MIYLTKGQKLFNNEGMVVLDQTGYYEDGATIICAMFHSPDEPVCSYEAKYIAYGEQVYNITDEKKLMEEIIKIDPNTLMGKTKEDITLDKMVEKIQTVDNPTPDITAEEDLVPKEEVSPITEKIETITEKNENGDVTKTTTTTTTTTTEEIIPEVVKPVVGEVVDPVVEPVVEEVVEVLDVPVAESPIVIPDEIMVPADLEQVVSKLRNKKKIF